MAVPTVIASGTNTSTNAAATPLAANLTGAVAGDIALAFISVDGAASIAANGAGWTKLLDVVGATAQSSFPTTATTGIPTGTTLTASGGFTASTNGAIYTNLDISGNVDVSATGVTFTRCRIRGVQFYALHILGGASVTLNDCEVYGTVPGVTPIYCEGTQVVNRCYIHDGDSLIIVGTAGNSTLNDSLLTDQWGRNTGGRSFSDGVLNGTTTVTSATANFVAGDVGANIWLNGSIPNETRIASRTNATTVIMDKAATVSGSGLTIGVADNVLGNHCECVKHTGGGVSVINHCAMWAKWGVNGSNGGGITGAFHCSGGALSVDNSLLVQYDGSGSYICYFVSGYTTASVTNCTLDHYDTSHVPDKTHQDSYDGAAPTWTNNKWGDGTTAPL